MARVTNLIEITPHLRLLEKNLIVPVLFGIQTFTSERKKMFPGFFELGDTSVKNGLPGDPTEETSSAVYEMIAGGNLIEILRCIDSKIEPFFWGSEAQIISWVKKHRQHLHPDGYGAFFPLITNGEYLTIHIGLHRETRLLGVSAAHCGQKGKLVFVEGVIPRLVIPQPE